jgi:hypothetical protein
MIIRPLQPEDAAQVASLWQYWFRGRTRTPDAGLVDLFHRLFFERPGADPQVTSLVAADGDGKLLGVTAVMPTPVLVDGAVQVLAGVFPSVRDPDAPPSVATFLLRRLLAGPQALSFSDGGHVKFERIWRGLGGHIAPTASLRWVKAFRPARLLTASRVHKGAIRAPRAPVLRPLADAADWVASKAQPGWFEVRDAAFVGEPLEPEALIEAMAFVHARTRLRPLYTPAYLTWLFAEMARIREQGALQANLVRTPDGTPVGWWVAYFNPGKLSRVFALDADERHVGGVVDHLFARAAEARVGGLTGRLEPRLQRAMATRGVFTHNGGSLMMVHGRDPRLVDDALLGRLALGRLEGENWYWWAIVSREVP